VLLAMLSNSGMSSRLMTDHGGMPALEAVCHLGDIMGESHPDGFFNPHFEDRRLPPSARAGRRSPLRDGRSQIGFCAHSLEWSVGRSRRTDKGVCH